MDTRRLLNAATIVILLAGITGLAQSKTSTSAKDKDALRIYFADVEGGQATLFVTPEGESLLVDTGNPGGRDADRIVALCKQAGVSKIDNLLITHYHSDHVGGLPELAAKMPIGRFIDHGENREPDNKATEAGWEAYQKVLAGGGHTHLVVKAGDVLPLKGMRADVVSGDGYVIPKALKGVTVDALSKNRFCLDSPEKPAEATENDRSVGLMITFGRLRIMDLGDLTWNKERGLVCPVDLLEQVDVYIASHHGLERSGSPALVNTVAPKVVIMDNGAVKGAAASAWDIVQHSPRIVALWQLHTAEHNDAAHNVPEARIANLPGPDAGHSLELVARKDGSIAVTNERTGESVEYPAAKGK